MKLRFRLKSLLLAIALVACPLAWVSWQRRSFEAELRATVALKQDYDANISSSGDPEYGIFEDPIWSLTEITTGRLYRPVDTISLAGVQLDQRAWDLLAACRYLRSLQVQECVIPATIDFDHVSLHGLRDLSIYHTPLSERQIAAIGRKQALTGLSLVNTKLTDDGVKSLGELHSLTGLALSENNISHRGLSYISHLKQLNCLRLDKTNCFPEGTHDLRCFSELEVLGLEFTGVDDRIADELKVLPKLRCLIIGNTNITDRTLVCLPALKELEELGLSDTHISDEGIRHLATLQKLHAVYLDGTLITDKSVDVLVELPMFIWGHSLVSKTKITPAGLRRLEQRSGRTP